MLRPFWSYYGGKYRVAPHYPAPTHSTIVEPFAGAAGYSLRYPDHRVVLIEKYAVIAELWRYLIATSADDVRRIPLVEAVADLPPWVPPGARALVGFNLNSATTRPGNVLSAGQKWLQAAGRRLAGWTEERRERVASQVDHIRHWEIIEGDYSLAPDVTATWFVDPPYDNAAGACYVHADIDYARLTGWALARHGQVIVCENEGASWLPFRPFRTFKPVFERPGSREVIYTQECAARE